MDGMISHLAMPSAAGLDRRPPAIFDLFGRVALVTGARRGIGRAIALTLAGQGTAVAVHHDGSLEEETDAAGVVHAVQTQGGVAWSFGADFAHPGSGLCLARDLLDRAGCVDILVLNASIEIHEDFGEIEPESLTRQVLVNLAEPLARLQALLSPMMQRGWGRVLAIGSTQQCRPSPRKLVYAATKAAQMSWVLNLARELGPHGITVNNLAPGVIATARNAVQIEMEGAKLVRGIPARRLGQPQDRAGAALLLCSDAGGYINGANLWVDGGRHIG